MSLIFHDCESDEYYFDGTFIKHFDSSEEIIDDYDSTIKHFSDYEDTSSYEDSSDYDSTIKHFE